MNFGLSVTASIRQFLPLRHLMVLVAQQAPLPRHNPPTTVVDTKAQANEETIRHPLDDPELEMHRQRIKALVAEYENNWRQSAK
jgi:hypothetical protein